MDLLVGKGVAHVAVTDSDKKGSQWLRLQQALGSSGEAQENGLIWRQASKHRGWLNNLGFHLALVMHRVLLQYCTWQPSSLTCLFCACTCTPTPLSNVLAALDSHVHQAICTTLT